MRALIVVLSILLPVFAQAADKVKVVTSFSILADMTRQIGGDYIQLENVVGADQDAHVYETSPDDARHVQQADLIIENGLSFEPWLDRLVTSRVPWTRKARLCPTRTPGTAWPTPRCTPATSCAA
jgi:zinc/manganese transport system substrate-binding protein